MKFLSVFSHYLGWHYSRGIVEMLINFKNFLGFVYNFFSISTLFRTLFSPFQRLKEEYRGGLNVSAFFESFVANLIMRFVGLFVRSWVIALGIIALVITFLCQIILFVLWIVAPVVLTFLFFSSLISIFKSI
jgi:hypothetical protein